MGFSIFCIEIVFSVLISYEVSLGVGWRGVLWRVRGMVFIIFVIFRGFVLNVIFFFE